MTADECRKRASKARSHSEAARDAVCKAGWLRTAVEWDERALIVAGAERVVAASALKPPRALEHAR
jgi:hypothetical protein